MSTPFIPERVRAADLVGSIMDVVETAEEESKGLRIRVDSVGVELPVELELDVVGGRVTEVRLSPPTQRTETTVMPALHGLMVRGRFEDVE